MKQIKIDDDVHEKLKQIAEKRQISINDLVRELLNIYLGGFSSERSIDKVITKEFVADTEKYCSKCRRRIDAGESITWVKYVYSDGSAKTIYYCFECANPSIGKVYRKKRELELVVKQLKSEADRLNNEINKLETIREFYKIKSDVLQFWKEFKNIVLNNPGVNINQFFDRLMELVDNITRLESAVESLSSVNSVRHRVFSRHYQKT
ncbi:MAG: CopG family transcriptional regulator [Ignisphaera sp.]